ncbi:hypothetical protein ACWEKT_07405 [Nocardia takedensis]
MAVPNRHVCRFLARSASVPFLPDVAASSVDAREWVLLVDGLSPICGGESLTRTRVRGHTCGGFVSGGGMDQYANLLKHRKPLVKR